jgi:hypothetical protein
MSRTGRFVVEFKVRALHAVFVENVDVLVPCLSRIDPGYKTEWLLLQGQRCRGGIRSWTSGQDESAVFRQQSESGATT